MGKLRDLTFDSEEDQEKWIKSVEKPDWEDELWEGVPEGSRHCSAVRLIGRYYGRGISIIAVSHLIRAWNESNLPPLPDSELESIIQSTKQWAHPQHIPPMSDEEAEEIVRLAKKELRDKHLRDTK